MVLPVGLASYWTGFLYVHLGVLFLIVGCSTGLVLVLLRGWLMLSGTHGALAPRSMVLSSDMAWYSHLTWLANP